MEQHKSAPGRMRSLRSKAPPGFRDLLDTLVSRISRDDTWVSILRRICASLLRFSGADVLSIRIDEEARTTRCGACIAEDGSEHVDVSLQQCPPREGESTATSADRLIPEAVVRAITERAIVAPAESVTRAGSFWIGDAARPILLREPGAAGASRTAVIGGDIPSLALVQVPVGQRSHGLMQLGSRRRDFFSLDDIHVYEAVAQTLGMALAHHGAQWALGERVKELTCLYDIATLARRPGIGLDELLSGIVAVLPPAWQYPDITSARIVLDGRVFPTEAFGEGLHRQSAPIVVNDTTRGTVEVVYTAPAPEMDEGPFLKEERSLIDEVARQVGLTVEHWETEEAAGRLQEQLRHAERLATIGQLSAGVAHELNEPLAAVLGFAELIRQTDDLGEGARQDADRIIKAALHAREIIRKLMIFTRQMPTRKVSCDLNQAVADGLYFLESRCAKEGIYLTRDLEPALPTVMADPSQIQQVLVNLVVNAIQAMPGGGRLIVRTRHTGDRVCLEVQDTGVGMSPDVQSRLFTPFFTTKDVGQGTGLGLAVVHGIVTAHGGTVSVRSAVGEGSAFELSLPAEGSREQEGAQS